MKTKLIFLLSLLWILIGCDDSDSATLNISESKFDNISASGESDRYYMQFFMDCNK